ncbi:MAG: hypothetical protein NC548_11335 [Lachnospiraceae bacterium]|nr:hypothetical protein [Lachnospiraceae bacterium]
MQTEWRKEFPTADISFLRFIDTMHDNYVGHDLELITSFMRDKYHWYFAHMFDLAFPNQGTVCFVYPDARFVWVDAEGIAYDIDGPHAFTESYVVPERLLGNVANDYKRLGNEPHLDTLSSIHFTASIIRAHTVGNRLDYEFWWINVPAKLRMTLNGYSPTVYDQCKQGNFEPVKQVIDAFIKKYMPNWGVVREY